MDRPVLHAFIRELVEHGRLAHAVVVLLPEDADARDAAEGAAWFLGDDAVGLLPSRGVSWESGLAPPPQLVGERARALHVLERGGLGCASARALAEGLPPAEGRPEALVRRAGLSGRAAGGG